MPILILLVVLYFISTQVGKVTSSVNNAAKTIAPISSVVAAGAAALGRFAGGTSSPLATPIPATTPTNTPYTYGGVTYTTSGGSGTVDSGPSQFSSAGVGSSSNTAYAPGASAPGPYAPQDTSSAFTDDLITPDFAST